MLAWATIILALAVGCESVDRPATKAKTLFDRVAQLEDSFNTLSRQVMLQQFYAEEKIRSDGDSGLKNIRQTRDGTKNYFRPSIFNGGFMAAHDHADYDRTVGLGELLMVMNGYEFRTRHNDYKLRMPSPTSSKYGAIVDIEYPPVPPSVLNKTSVEDQIAEMRQYFRAFKTQNINHRDYRPYFKPVLCYIEGAWTLSKGAIDEPFQSDRHSIDADTWFDLMDKARFASYTGSKSLLENFALLPTSIYDVKDGVPQLAQWNYRILCHPLKNDLPIKNLVLENDLATRLPNGYTMASHDKLPKSRYHLNDQDKDHYTAGDGLLDRLMMEIPGKDNYQANLNDHSLDLTVLDARFPNRTLLNTGYYHRYMKTQLRDAMGSNKIHRGFSDSFLFAAQTTQERVAPMTVKACKNRPTCKEWTTRYSYAIPLEIIYTTPLYNWNPYNITIAGGQNFDKEGRTGGLTPDTAYKAAHRRGYYYLTPASFYDSRQINMPKRGILDGEGKVRALAPSGTNIIMRSIPGVGRIKLRYPIVPLHSEGNPAFEELNALREITMNMDKYRKFILKPLGEVETSNEAEQETKEFYNYETSVGSKNIPAHTHTFFLTADELQSLKEKRHAVAVETSQEMGHTHTLELFYSNGKVLYFKCDGMRFCFDGHGKVNFEV